MNELSTEIPDLCLFVSSGETELRPLAQAVCSAFPAKLTVIRHIDELLQWESCPSLILHVDREHPMTPSLESALTGPLRLWPLMVVRESDVAISDRVSSCCDWGVVERPVRSEWLIDRLNDMLESSRDQSRLHWLHGMVDSAIGRLTQRQQTVLGAIIEGLPTKTIAKQLGVSNRLIEMERSVLLRQFSVASTPELTLKYGQYDAYETLLRIRHRQAAGWESTGVVQSAC